MFLNGDKSQRVNQRSAFERKFGQSLGGDVYLHLD